MKANLFDCKLRYWQESPSGKALLLSETDNRDDAVWFPKAELEIDQTRFGPGDYIDVTMPQWLAEEKELV